MRKCVNAQMCNGKQNLAHLRKCVYGYSVMSIENSLKRRNVSWSKATDELAEKLALDKDMKVSQLLEQLLLEEAKHNRIGEGNRSTLLEFMRDVASSVFEELANKAESSSHSLKDQGQKKIKASRQAK